MVNLTRPFITKMFALQYRHRYSKNTFLEGVFIYFTNSNEISYWSILCLNKIKSNPEELFRREDKPGKVVPRVSFSLYWQVKAVVLDGKIASKQLLHLQQREAVYNLY
jgi:hypothetical protein